MHLRYPVSAMLFAAGTIGATSIAKPAPAELPGNLFPTYPRGGVDHVVTYALWRGWGPKDGDRVVVARHGAMIRTEVYYIGSKRAGENDHTTYFSNIDTAASLSIARDSGGALSAVSIDRGGPGDFAIYRHKVAATGASERIAGEGCAVWLAEPETKDGARFTACITRDGIVLRETVLYTDGKVMEEKRAIKIERRPVRPKQVLPPAEALDWPIWAAHAPTVATAADDSADNYDLTLAGKQGGKSVTKVLRKAGGWNLEEDRIDSTIGSLLIFGPAATFSYSSHDNPMLRISRQGRSLLTDPRELKSAPFAKPAETVINEGCTWYNAAVNVSDYARLECRSRDHLPLIREEYSWGSLRVTWLATGLTRGRTPSGSITPPAPLLSWTYWGWPELDAGGRR